MRITVFRDFPYLYDGKRAFERDFLAAYAQSRGALVVGAFDNDRLIGAALATPMADHPNEFATPFIERGIDIDQVYYFGGIMLLPEWRRRKVGDLFFDRREARARDLGFPIACFSTVVRPPDHPARPDGYAPPDSFWRARNYAPVQGLVAQYRWKETGDADKSDHAMQFWVKHLDV
ncbi:MAG TPA: GNAT family N-acetyltransferase [Sphingobium sp.]